MLDSPPAMDPKPESGHARPHHRARLRLPLKISHVSWSDLALTLGLILIASIAAILLALHFVRPMPPRTLVMSGGPKGSSFENFAERYRAILAENGIDLQIKPSAG